MIPCTVRCPSTFLKTLASSPESLILLEAAFFGPSSSAGDLDHRGIDRGLEHDVRRRDLLLDDRPLVDHPDAFHQDEVGAHRLDVGAVEFDLVGGLEVVVARLPAEQLEDVLRDLHLQRGLQVFLADEVARDQDVAEPLQRVLLLLKHLFELLSGELALLHEQVAEPVLDALGRTYRRSRPSRSRT
jgi:hypothetical protein